MEKVYLLNAFSLQMIEFPAIINVNEVSVKEVSEGFTDSAVGHVDTANVLSNLLGKDVQCNRINVRLSKGDCAYVAQVTGGRLPEGTTTLPDGFALKFLKVEVR